VRSPRGNTQRARNKTYDRRKKKKKERKREKKRKRKEKREVTFSCAT
jgi:hypothetical protein